MCIIEAVSQELPWGYYVDDDTVRDLVKSGELPEKPERMTDPVWRLVQRMCSFEPANRLSLESVVEKLGEVAQDASAQRVSLPNISAHASVANDNKSARQGDIQNILKLPTLAEKSRPSSPAANSVVETRQPQRPHTPRDAGSL